MRLTERQRQALIGIARGEKCYTIARKLKISPKTAEYHRAELGKRLGCRGSVPTALLTQVVLRLGLVDWDHRIDRLFETADI